MRCAGSRESRGTAEAASRAESVTKFKFCGLREARDATHAAAIGATYGGVILTKSIRQVTPERAREIFADAPALKRVGVMGRDALTRILSTAADAGLDILQLHAGYTVDEHAQIRQEFEGEIWAVIGMDARTGEPVREWREISDIADALLLDTGYRGRAGGTGKTFNWRASAETIAEIRKEIPVVLAGGLTAGNVTQAIEELRPAVVDVSSGVEASPGVKSPEMMTAFARAVLSASIV